MDRLTDDLHMLRLSPVALFLVVTLASAWPTAWAQAPDAERSGRGNGKLPLTDVVLFSSGVSYFQRNAIVDGDARVELRFRAEDINDLLKSLVTQDLGGGRMSTVTYTSRDPMTRTLQSFAIDLTDNPTIADLLSQVRGEQVVILAPEEIRGTIVGIEQTRKPVGQDKSLQMEKLLLLTEGGLRTIRLSQARSIQLVRPQLQRELEQALKILAQAHNTDKKTVVLNFSGDGQRQIRVGYITESPIWKTTYRLVVAQDKVLLQGWAIVENTTEEDWTGVALTLVSGRPISFRMDLYQPLYVRRPEVKPELYASLRPQKYQKDLMAKRLEELQEARAVEALPQVPPPATLSEDSKAPRADRFRENNASADGFIDALAGKGGGLESMAQAGDVGELFRYVIDTPVTIRRRQSALLPIANESVEAEKVSIYNPSVQAKHPLNGLRLKNTTALNLMQGPVTVFDENIYAGDARLPDLAPGAERLISYALDLDTEVVPESQIRPKTITSVKLVGGQQINTTKQQRIHKYVVKNSAPETKTVLIEYPREASWELVHPKPLETTRSLYRFSVVAEPGMSPTLEVVEERTDRYEIALSNLGSKQIRLIRAASSDAVKVALDQLLALQEELAEFTQQIDNRQEEIQAINTEQHRIRQNMPRIEPSSELFARYLKKFSDQESRLEHVREEITSLQAQRVVQQQKIAEFLQDLDVQ